MIIKLIPIKGLPNFYPQHLLINDNCIIYKWKYLFLKSRYVKISRQQYFELKSKNIW